MGRTRGLSSGYILVLISIAVSTFVFTSCSNSPDTNPDPVMDPASPVSEKLINASHPLHIPTYDGSGQATEPSVRAFPEKWHGFRYWMAMDPFPHSDQSKENPSILVSNDGTDWTWTVPPGLTNPLAFPPNKHQLFSDCDLFFDANSNQLWVYFVWNFAEKTSRIMRVTSSDGVHWSTPEILLEVPNFEWLSPSVQKVGTLYFLWTVNATPLENGTRNTKLEFRISLDGANWSQPQVSDFPQTGYQIWHPEVTWVDSKQEFWMLTAAFKNGENEGHTILFFANSADALHWTTYSKPALEPTTPPDWDSRLIYRTGFTYDPGTDLLQVWYSAWNGSAWHIGHTQANFSQFLQNLQN